MNAEVVEFRRLLDTIVRKSQERLREWQRDYERLFDRRQKEDDRKLFACKPILHEYFACESVLFEQDLEKLGRTTDLARYAEMKFPLLPKRGVEVGLHPLVREITPPATICFGRFLVDGKKVDLRNSQRFAEFRHVIHTEPIASWVKRNRQRDGLDSWFYPIPWTEMGIPHAGEKYPRFFEDTLALDGRYGGLLYMEKQQPRVNQDLRYAFHKIVRSSIREGVEHWFAHIEVEMKQDKRIRAWHEMDDRSIFNTYKQVKKELWDRKGRIRELPADLTRFPARFDPERAATLRIFYDPVTAGDKQAKSDSHVSEESAVRKFLSVIEKIGKTGLKSNSYLILRTMLEIRNQYQKRREAGWFPARALDDAVWIIMKKYRNDLSK